MSLSGELELTRKRKKERKRGRGEECIQIKKIVKSGVVCVIKYTHINE